MHGKAWGAGTGVVIDWQQRIERALAYAHADVILIALGHIFAERQYRLCPGREVGKVSRGDCVGVDGGS